MPAHKLHQAIRTLRRAALRSEGVDLSDGQILHWFLAEREEAAFEILLRRHGRMVLGVCQRILRNACDAEDAFQATFLVLFRKADVLLGRQTIGDWLYGVAQNTALKARAAAARRRVKEREAGERSATELPVEEILWQEWRPLLDREVLCLPAKYRALIILCDLEQKTYKEAAILVGCSAGTVAGRLSRVRDLLARRLTRYGVNLSVAALTALLAQTGAAASLPASLAGATLNAVAGAASAPVVSLSQGVLQAMWMNKMKQVLAVFSLVGCLSLGAGAVLYQALTAQPATAQAKSTDAPDEARAVIERAIKAHGGAENLAKFKTFSAKMEGKFKAENAYWDATNVVRYQLPDRMRIDSEITNPKGNTYNITRAVNGTKGWMGAGTRSREMREADLKQMQDEMYAHWLATVAPLKDKGFAFSLVGQAPVDEKEAMGVRVSREGRPDVNLYFDLKSGLLVKSERRSKDATGQEYNAECFYRDHKAFQGVMWPTKRVDKRDSMDLDQGGGRFEFSDYQARDLDESVFAKPE